MDFFEIIEDNDSISGDKNSLNKDKAQGEESDANTRESEKKSEDILKRLTEMLSKLESEQLEMKGTITGMQHKIEQTSRENELLKKDNEELSVKCRALEKRINGIEEQTLKTNLSIQRVICKEDLHKFTDSMLSNNLNTIASTTELNIKGIEELHKLLEYIYSQRELVKLNIGLGNNWNAELPGLLKQVPKLKEFYLERAWLDKDEKLKSLIDSISYLDNLEVLKIHQIRYASPEVIQYTIKLLTKHFGLKSIKIYYNRWFAEDCKDSLKILLTLPVNLPYCTVEES